VDKIKEKIEDLNHSLRHIDYSPSTFIQLASEHTRNLDVADFKDSLQACFPDVGRLESNEVSFQRIKALIERFETEESWMTKVTDVRNWLEFSASERYHEDESEKNYYSDSSGKSGGQKAKLAYTILASAIAYQFNLKYEGGKSKSFCFVVVDEAFSKSDEANSRYAMELFKRLGLQLLVVTPLDKIHIVEPYISAFHFVTNNSEENDSELYSVPMERYRQQKNNQN
jgi:uncharacterized protein YPO0396